MSSLSEISLKRFNLMIRETQKYPNSVFDLTINIVRYFIVKIKSQDNFEHNASVLLD